MKKVIFSGFALMVLLQTSVVSANSSVERPKGKKNATYASVSSEIKDMLDFHDFGAINKDNGKVMISYYVDQNNLLHIKDIGSNNAELRNYVLETLEGKKVHAANVENNKDNVLKLNFDLGSN